MVGGPAGGDPHRADAAHELVIELGVLQPDLAVLVQAAGQGLGHDRGLFVNLLEHEVGKPAFFGLLGIPLDVQGVTVDGSALDGLDRGTLSGDHNEFVVLDDQEIPCAVQQGGNV